MSLPKGQTNNPNGRPPKGECLTDLMRTFLDKVDEKTKIQNKVIFIEKVFELANTGDTVCMKLIWNYIDGMPKQNIAIEGSITSNSILKALEDVKNNNNTDISDVKPKTD